MTRRLNPRTNHANCANRFRTSLIIVPTSSIVFGPLLWRTLPRAAANFSLPSPSGTTRPVRLPAEAGGGTLSRNPFDNWRRVCDARHVGQDGIWDGILRRLGKTAPDSI